MSKNALISEVQKFHFGNKIFCVNGQAGSLVRVLFNASSKKLTHLAVKQNRLFGKTFYVPFTAVTRATGEGIRLQITLAELAAFPESAGPGVELDGRSAVQGRSVNGSLILVAVHPGSGELAYIVARNVPAGRDTLLREQYVTKLAPDQVFVSIDDQVLEALPPYRPDHELQREVEEIIFDLGFLHIDLKGLRLRVLDGVLYMEGNISSALRGELARDQVAGVSGLLEVKNNLVGDDTLAADIAHALGQDERTRDLPIGVYPQLGVVRLSGSVRNEQQKAAAGEIAQKFDGVCGVINDLIVDPSADMLYVMSAPEGGETRDITPGKFIRHTK
ncbi:MAG TPA: BON domain-containing protein [Ktedonobacteraceae bacterium]